MEVSDTIYGTLIVRLKREIVIRGFQLSDVSSALKIRHETLLEYMRAEKYMPMLLFCKVCAYLEVFPIIVDLGIVELMEWSYGALHNEIDTDYLSIKKVKDTGIEICEATKVRRNNINRLVKMELVKVESKYKKGSITDKELQKDLFYDKSKKITK